MSPALATIWWTKSQSEPAPRPHPLRETGRLERELEVAGGRCAAWRIGSFVLYLGGV
jgi:hypothetical protein